MRPLVLRDIADECELHESTVSRVTSQKFMLTPLGCFELKYFFGSHVSTDDGGTASATALRAQIADWIKNETPGKPLSDQAIADRFGETGVVVARRTVAKYREALRIPSAAQRRHR
jgi:RNA polymerase sigma-54 factor